MNGALLSCTYATHNTCFSFTQLVLECSKWGDMLSADANKASAAVEQWRAVSAATSKLERMLREGATAHQLSRTIQEAASFGVQVGEKIVWQFNCCNQHTCH